MSRWPPFSDPLYRLFDWPHRSARENRVWFTNLLRDRTRVYYAVENESNDLIGRISLREIRAHHSARLGIGFGAQFVGQGYGTDALRIFLRHFFLDLGFGTMVLDVAAINERAVRCYERCGFEFTGSHYEYLAKYQDMMFLQEEPYQHLQRFCESDARRGWILTYDMALTKRQWIAQEEAMQEAQMGIRHPAWNAPPRR
jgi:RimJ/RimL family protein N-acetyltransferase